MKIDGKSISENILQELSCQVKSLKIKGITPALAVILVGDDPASLSYIRQKQKAAEKIGAKLILEHLPGATSATSLSDIITRYNTDLFVHGLIIQRPIPSGLGDVRDILNSVTPKKDIDGFLRNSAFQVPVARGVITILKKIHIQLSQQKLIHEEYIPWLTKQTIAVVGRGETAGRPIATLLHRLNCATSIIHSQTPNPNSILKSANIIISCVGKKGIITKRNIKPGAIIISVGIWRDSKGKLHGDYEEEAIKNTASFYTPTPGGVGPVNVASLMQNLMEAVALQVA